jgi:GNAT superfamily N-acetyltransferase
MPKLAFHSADRDTSEKLSALIKRAYADYAVPMQVDAAGFEAMVAAYDIDLHASRVGALGGEPIAIALLGVRERRGWIGGLGVAPERRNQGVGRATLEATIKTVRRLKLRALDLEVLTDNLPAIHLYEALGFRRRRTLDVWMRDSDATFPMPPRENVGSLEVAPCLAVFDDLHVASPPWQRDLPTLRRMAATLHALGITDAERIAAYVLYRMDGARVSILDAAAAPGHRTAAIESVLRVLIRDRAGSPIRLANLPQDDPVSSVMHLIGARVAMQQYEMTLDL